MDLRPQELGFSFPPLRALNLKSLTLVWNLKFFTQPWLQPLLTPSVMLLKCVQQQRKRKSRLKEIVR